MDAEDRAAAWMARRRRRNFLLGGAVQAALALVSLAALLLGVSWAVGFAGAFAAGAVSLLWLWRGERRAARSRPASYDPSEQPEPADTELLDLLQSRDGVETAVVLDSGERLAVWDIGWGYDVGDEYAHVLTNGSPSQDGRPLDSFFTTEVRSVLDPRSGSVLWDRAGRAT